MNFIKVLGASGSRTKDKGTTCFQIYKDILIDAGNIISALGEEAQNINHIFLTHSHSDHIIDLPFVVESFFEKRDRPLTIYGSKQTLDAIKAHTFNNHIWPDFSKINLINSDEKAIVYKQIDEEETISINDYNITAIKALHTQGSYGYEVIKNDEFGYIVSGDTTYNEELIQRINKNTKIKSLILECSFPNRMSKLTKESYHLNVEMIEKMLKKNTRDDLQVFLYHLKPIYFEEIKKEISVSNIFKNGGKILEDEDTIHIQTSHVKSNSINHQKFEKIMEINLELSSQLNKNKLFEMILSLTRELTGSEAGTLYLLSEDKKHLDFAVVQNKLLKIELGGTKNKIEWPNLPLYINKNENLNMVATTCALKNEIINIEDVYDEELYDFSGTKEFDKNTGYNSKSMLVIPLQNHEKDVVGVLQLINKKDEENNSIAFDKEDEKILTALASQAAMALTNTLLINSLEEFINSFVETIGHAIDAKSPHTLHHIENVEKIALLLANAINDDQTIYKNVTYSKNDFRQIKLAAWLHDIGKISMPESIIEKATKLYAITDRIEAIKERFEILKRDIEISYLKNEIPKKEFEEKYVSIEEDLKFLEKTNIGGEFLDDESIERLNEIAKLTYIKDGKQIPLLSEDEIKHLSIRKGTLTSEEKDIMNSHARLSLEMLSKLPFPKKYNKVLDIAVNHHEKLNGKGYPRGLKDEDLTLEDRIMILADIFEALTSSDRPYKDGKKLSEVFKILSFMAKDYEIDPDLLRFFHEHQILKDYSKDNLKTYQTDNSELIY